MKSKKMIPSKHFQLELVAEGVYAAVQKPEGCGLSNSGVIDLGSRTVVFDTFLTPHAAEDLLFAAEELTNHPVNIVVNSHYHSDHTWGNQVFSSNAEIISTNTTRRLINTAGMSEYKWFKENSPQLEALYGSGETVGNDSYQKYLMVYQQCVLKALTSLTIRLPNLTFTGRMKLFGSNHSVELRAYSGGHTASDTVLYIPQERIIFMSDLLSVGSHPYLVDGDPQELVRILSEIKTMQPRVLIPGHGPPGDLHDLDLMIRYVGDLEKIAQRLYEKGDPEEKISKIPIPKSYDRWEYPDLFYKNLRFFYLRLQRLP